MNRSEAEAIARDALIWLAGQPEMLGQFLAASGASPQDLRARVRDPEFLGFVLDHLLGSEAAVIDFATAAGLRPEAPGRARALLPGGAVPDWT